MATPAPSPQQNNGLQLADEFGRTSVVHSNVGSEVIITTVDKIKLALIDHQRYVKIKKDWLSPVSICLAALTTLAAADFKDFLSVNADTWRAIFFIILVVSAVWSAVTIFRALWYLNKGNANEIIEQLKTNSTPP